MAVDFAVISPLVRPGNCFHRRPCDRRAFETGFRRACFGLSDGGASGFTLRPASGHAVFVDFDLEKFNHDILMGLVHKRVAGKHLLKLIRAFLNAGVMEGGLVSPTEEGVPQGAAGLSAGGMNAPDREGFNRIQKASSKSERLLFCRHARPCAGMAEKKTDLRPFVKA